MDGHVSGSVCVPAFDWQHGFYTPRKEFPAEVMESIGTTSTSSKVLLCCMDGKLSAGACAALVDSGLYSADQVEVLEGGLRAWEASELEELIIDDDGEGGLVGAWV